MELNYGINAGTSIHPVNDILADRNDPVKVEVLSVSAAVDFVIKRGQLLKKGVGQSYVPIADKVEIEDDTFIVVALNEFVVQATGSKVACTSHAHLIQQRLLPNDVPVGLYNYGNLVIKKEFSL